MSRTLNCTFNKEYLQRATLLYVEDEEISRNEASEIFAAFFKRVYVAKDGQEGFELFEEHRNEIDIILTDINMPRLNGIELLTKIRGIDWDLPILISTAFKETDILLKAIKFNVQNYIIKPMQLNTTLKIVSQIIENIENKKELVRQEYELKQFLSILDSKNLMCDLDIELKILSVNDLFIASSGFDMKEIIGKDFIDLNESCNTSAKIIDITNHILKGRVWSGDLKKVNSKGEVYFTHSTIIPIFNNDGSIKKFTEFATLTTKYENEILQLKKHIMSLKTESFRASSELKNENTSYVKLAEKLQKQVDDTVNNSQQLILEMYDLKKRNTYLEEKFVEQEKRFEKFQAGLDKG